MQINSDQLSRYLAGQSYPFLSVAEDKRAAVLVPLVEIDGSWSLLFIRRAEVKEDPHSGQVAFPGGRLEKQETEQEAALREAGEEISIQINDVCVLGCLPDFMSVNGYRVRPIVGTVPWPYEFQIQQSEVSRIFSIPLNWLSQPEHCRIESRTFNGHTRDVIYYQKYDGELLWGLTAAMTHSLLDMLARTQEKL